MSTEIRYTLTAPLVIGPRLVPAVMVAMGTDTYGTVHAEIDYHDGERYVLHYVIDTPGGTYEGRDVRSGTRPVDWAGDDLDAILRDLMGTLLSFLGAEAEAYEGSGQMGSATPPDGWMFNAQIAEWAYLNSDELFMLRLQLDGDLG